MNEIRFHKDFKKDLQKFSPKIQAQFWERFKLWQQEPFYPALNHHVLSGRLAGKHSINITGDVRAIYEELNDGSIVFILIGSHSQLYK